MALGVGVFGVHGGSQSLDRRQTFVFQEAVELIGVGARVRPRQGVEAADAVAPELFGARNGEFGGQDQALGFGGVGAELGAADAECQAVGQVGDGGADHLGEGLGLGETALREQDSEFFPAETGRDGDLWEAGLERLGHVLHCLVSRRVTVALVESPEVIQVQQQQ